jgi:hypothetical protein|tara:strand:- start:458 stop:1561 length:1104 start_codon:yes stop_codon:yes gene_type:complete
MALTSSGQISMSDIRSELGDSGSISLKEASDGTIATINTNNDSSDRPDGAAPHAMTEFYSYDHDLAGTSWSVTDNTNVNISGFPGDTEVSNKDAQMTVSNGSGGTSCSVSTTGGPFGTFTLAISSSGDPGALGTSNSGSGFISTSSANSNSLFTGHNSGTRYIRTRWAHSPSNKDGTGAYTLTLTNNSVSATVTGSITFSGGGGGGFGLCIYENIPVNLKEGTANIHDLDVGDMIMSYNWETGQEEEVEIQQIEKRLHSNLYKIMLSDPNDETEGEELKELILTQDHPVYKEDGSMVSDDPSRTAANYDLEAAAIQPNDLLKILDGKYYAQVHRLEGFPKKHWTYTILTKNNNFYANGVLVHSEIGE